MPATSRLVEVCTGTWVATSRRYATTSTVLLDGLGGAVVIDPAWDPDELAAIPADLATLGVRCIAGLATHEHYDHVMWHPALGEVPRYGTEGTARRLATDRHALLAPLADYLTPDLIAIAGRLEPLPGGELPWAGPRAECVVHHAHAPDHLALFVERTGVLVCGDMLSDVELPMPAKDDVTLKGYAEGLEHLRDVVGRATWLVPGHGRVTGRPTERLDADRRYLDDLLAGRKSQDPRIADPENAALHRANLRRANVPSSLGPEV
jgi:glyoxylase-like metal-dependent hydrolase (beta-lactamase superfamily II)